MGHWRRKKERAIRSSPEFSAKRILQNRDVGFVFDVGGNTGEWTDSIIKALTPKKVYVFEPFPIHFEKLNKKYSLIESVSIFDTAIGNENGKRAFYINSDPRYNHSLLSIDPASDGWVNIDHTSTKEVQCSTIDHFCFEHEISHISLLKIDTEGADFLVLQGAKRMLENARIDIVYVEIFLKPLMKGQGSLTEIISFMEAHGYYLFNFFDQRFRGGRLVLTNAMFVHQDIM
jgi:FkbM family methyltransferase